MSDTRCVLESDRPGSQSSASSARREWQRPQVSSSVRSGCRTLRCAVAPPASRLQVTPLRSAKATARPLFDGAPAAGLDAVRPCAQSTWVDPGPWQASHPTSISDHVVLYRLLAAS